MAARKNKSSAPHDEDQDQTLTSESQGNGKMISINDITFEVPTPYAEGHVCSAVEAGVLNQTLSQNLRNNFAPTVKKALDAAKHNGHEVDLETLREKFNAYAAEYVFSERRIGRGPVDPVEREAVKLAKEAIRAAAGRDNIALRAEDVEALATQLLHEQGEPYYTEARRRVETRKQVTAQTLDLTALRTAAMERHAP